VPAATPAKVLAANVHQLAVVEGFAAAFADSGVSVHTVQAILFPARHAPIFSVMILHPGGVAHVLAAFDTNLLHTGSNGRRHANAPYLPLAKFMPLPDGEMHDFNSGRSKNEMTPPSAGRQMNYIAREREATI
jgi:hypothetical protein